MRCTLSLSSNPLPSKVFIVEPWFGVDPMFSKWGWKQVDNIEEADLVQFTGGEDINPRIYDQAKHHLTHFNDYRDVSEIAAFKIAQAHKKPMAGICRGAQFLCAMFGGALWQHVDAHNRGAHLMTDTETGEVLMTTSVHHQMMIPGAGAKIVATAQESKHKERMGIPGSKAIVISRNLMRSDPDVEAVWWPDHAAFGIQGHPECNSYNLDRYYFQKLHTLLGLKTQGI